MIDILGISTQAAFAILALALAITLIRALRGPSLGDRIVALDLALLITVGLFGANAISAGEIAILDAAVIISLVAFLGTIAMAAYLERREP
jgi:multicomponent Na+:H+ antiporter subunit F